MFEVVKLQGALDLYVCPIPQVCLVKYYFKNLDVVFESDDEVTSIYRGHEKAKNDASTISFEKIVAWEKEELQSPSYLRSPHVWKSNSVGISKGKVLLDDFEIVGNGKDKVVLDDAKDGLIKTKSVGDWNEGSSSSSNLN
nr:transposase, MuDR, MULE transposase domain protein [Tanacetum cinerariifolium]